MPNGISSIAPYGVTAGGCSDVVHRLAVAQGIVEMATVPRCPLETLPRFRRRGDVISSATMVAPLVSVLRREETEHLFGLAYLLTTFFVQMQRFDSRLPSIGRADN